MHPYLLRIGGLSIPSYPILYGTGIALAGWVAIRLGIREGLSPRKMAHLVLLMAVLILIGGRAFYVFQHLADFQGRWSDAVDLSEGGQVFYGGLMLALVGLVLFCRAAKMLVWPTLDVISVGAPLGLVFGRLGCFCRGCCYGRVTDLAWAVRFPPHVDLQGNVVGSPAFLRHVELGLIAKSASASLPVHPSQLYSAGVSLIVFGVMLWLWKSRRLSGRLVFAYLGLYAVTRFFLEFTRDNEMAFWGLTIAQVVSLVIVGLSVTTFLLVRPVLARVDEGDGCSASATSRQSRKSKGLPKCRRDSHHPNT